MIKKRLRGWMSPIFACLLVVAASGDDFNFARLSLIPSDTAEDVLPLDDPNTDFTESSRPTTTSQNGPERKSQANRLRMNALLIRPFALPTHRFPTRLSLNSPLRC